MKGKRYSQEQKLYALNQGGPRWWKCAGELGGGWQKSQNAHGSSLTRPAGTTPGQRAIAAWRSAPS